MGRHWAFWLVCFCFPFYLDHIFFFSFPFFFVALSLSLFIIHFITNFNSKEDLHEDSYGRMQKEKAKDQQKILFSSLHLTICFLSLISFQTIIYIIFYFFFHFKVAWNFSLCVWLVYAAMEFYYFWCYSAFGT